MTARRRRCNEQGRAWAVAAFLAVAASSFAGSALAQSASRSIDGLSGVAINQTITPVGQNFFRAFAAAWHDKDINSRVSVTVFERASARWGSLIWVEHSGRRVYQTVLHSGRGNGGNPGQDAAAIVYQNAMQYELEAKLFKDPDLAGDEL